MSLTPEIIAAARQLGQSLREDEYVRVYLQAEQEAAHDPELSSQETQVRQAYETLIAREQAGEASGESMQTFQALHQRTYEHPLIARRNQALRRVRPRLAEVTDEISLVLGLNYTAFAKPQ